MRGGIMVSVFAFKACQAEVCLSMSLVEVVVVVQ